MREGAKEKIAKRASIFTLVCVIILFVVFAVVICKIYYKLNKDKSVETANYVSNLLEEDKMQYEYKKINKSLNGMYALAISSKDSLVAINKENKTIPIINIDPSKEYEYLYYDKSIYLLEKESGILSIIPLNTDNEVFEISETIKFSEEILYFQINSGKIYYISGSFLKVYYENKIETIYDNVTSDSFVIKNDVIYIVLDNNLVKIENNEITEIDKEVKDINYYSYYEKNKIIYSVVTDGEYEFRKIYNVYTDEVTNSIKNNTYFIPHGSLSYVYLSNDRKSIAYINKAGSTYILYESDVEIIALNYLYKDYIQVITESENITINLNNKKIIEDKEVDYIEDIYILK